MKLGGFGRTADYDSIREAGFAYAELDLPELEALPEREFQVFCAKVKACGFPVLVGARALPIAEPWFFTEQFSMTEYEGYLLRACRRAKELGMEKVILGNGKARWLMDGADLKKESRFIGFMRMFARIAGEYGLEVILEPLGPRYSNYINTLPEAVRVIREVGMPNLYTMADLRHMLGAGEPFGHITEYGDYIRHIHVDYPAAYPERPFPSADDGFDYSPFLQAVKMSGYEGGITVEADIPKDWDSAYGKALLALRCIARP